MHFKGEVYLGSEVGNAYDDGVKWTSLFYPSSMAFFPIHNCATEKIGSSLCPVDSLTCLKKMYNT